MKYTNHIMGYAMIAVAGSYGLFASHPAAAEAVTAVERAADTPIRLHEDGIVLLPGGFVKSAWLDVYSGAHQMPVLSGRLRTALTNKGFSFASDEQSATASLSISGYVKLTSEDKKSFNPARIFLGELLEPGVHANDGNAGRRVSSRGALDYDAGVASGGSKLLAQAGLPSGLLAGAAFAIVADWLAETTGLRSAVNGAFSNDSKPTWRSPSLERKVWFCDDACKRTTHEAVVTISVWKSQKQLSYYTVSVSQVLPDIDRTAIEPIIQAALGRAVERILEASQ